MDRIIGTPPVPGQGKYTYLTWCDKTNKLYAMRDGHCYILLTEISGNQVWQHIVAYIHKGKCYELSGIVDLDLYLERIEIS